MRVQARPIRGSFTEENDTDNYVVQHHNSDGAAGDGTLPGNPIKNIPSGFLCFKSFIYRGNACAREFSCSMPELATIIVL